MSIGVLVQQFHILQQPHNFWYVDEIANVMKSIIKRNMTVEDRKYF